MIVKNEDAINMICPLINRHILPFIGITCQICLYIDKQMIKPFTLLIALFIAGCSENIESSHLFKSIKICRKAGGIKHISLNTGKMEKYIIKSVQCNNGAVFYSNDIEKISISKINKGGKT